MTLPGPVVCIVGPTASGKSELAERVAERLGTEVVSVDAMQVYRGMDVGTAKTPCERRRAPLRMVDVCDPLDNYSVSLFQREARSCVDGLLDSGRVPVLAGGSGLYLDAVIDEMEFPAGARDDGRRRRYEALASERGYLALHALLADRDPESAAIIDPRNTRRVVRALEMLDDGVTYAGQLARLRERPPHYAARIWGLTMARERLYARIDERVDLMMAEGLLDEVRALAARGLTTDVTAGQAIGYKELLGVLDGSRELADAVELIKRRTRHYAKRQLSWIRRDGRARPIDLDETSLDEACDLVVSDAQHAAPGEAGDYGTL